MTSFGPSRRFGAEEPDHRNRNAPYLPTSRTVVISELFITLFAVKSALLTYHQLQIEYKVYCPLYVLTHSLAFRRSARHGVD